MPYLQNPTLASLNFYVRTERDPAQTASSLRAEVRRLDSQLPVEDVKTLTTQLSESLLTERLTMLLAVAFGGLAALLAAIGIYGVLAFAVAQRRQEIGVRMALGADPAAVRRLILGEVARFLLVGAAIGLPAAYALATVVESILFGVHASDVRRLRPGDRAHGSGRRCWPGTFPRAAPRASIRWRLSAANEEDRP